MSAASPALRPERLGAGDGLAGGGGGEHGVAVEVVGQRDDTRSTSGSAHSSSIVAHARLAEPRRVTPRGAPGSASQLTVTRASRHVAQAQGVELADEPAAQHPHADGRISSRPLRPAAAAAGASPALRARKSRMIASVAVAPIRVTPRSMTASSASSVRTPPAALTRTCGEVLARISRRSSWVAPDGAKPGAGLDEVAAGGLGEAAGADLLVIGEVGVLEDHLDDRARGVRDLDDGADVVLDVLVAAGLEGADLEHHVQLGGPVREGPPRLGDLGLGEVVAVREADGRPHRDIGARRGSPRRAATSAGPDAHGRDVVLRGQAAAGLHEGVVQLGPEQAVVDGLGDVALGEVGDREGHVAPWVIGVTGVAVVGHRSLLRAAGGAWVGRARCVR